MKTVDSLCIRHERAFSDKCSNSKGTVEFNLFCSPDNNSLSL